MTGLLIFACTYAWLSFDGLPRAGLGRSSIALLGAGAALLAGEVTPAQAVHAVDLRILVLLFSVGGIGTFLEHEGVFRRLEAWLLPRVRTRGQLLGGIVWGAGFGAALLTNDVICLLGTPLVVRWIQRLGLPPVPFLLAVATAANTGSVATLVGNPQNLLCGLLGGLTYRSHLLLAGPVALVGLMMNHLLLAWTFRGELSAPIDAPTDADSTPPVPLSLRGRVALVALAGMSVLYVTGVSLEVPAAVVFAILFALYVRDPQRIDLARRLDWSLPIFFTGLFIVVEALVRTGLPAQAFERWPWVDPATGLGALAQWCAQVLVASNIVSNVPLILVVRGQVDALSDPRLGWELLAVVSTLAGNLALLGSAANIIVAEKGRPVGGLGFVTHLRVGVPLTLLTTALGALWLTWMGG